MGEMPPMETTSAYRIARCGLVCSLCSERAGCPGCTREDCARRRCCIERGQAHCFSCEAYPCARCGGESARMRAFNLVAREEGPEKLSAYLQRNAANGLVYHRGGLTGDYDRYACLLYTSPSPRD